MQLVLAMLFWLLTSLVSLAVPYEDTSSPSCTFLLAEDLQLFRLFILMTFLMLLSGVRVENISYG